MNDSKELVDIDKMDMKRKRANRVILEKIEINFCIELE